MRFHRIPTYLLPEHRRRRHVPDVEPQADVVAGHCLAGRHPHRQFARGAPVPESDEERTALGFSAPPLPAPRKVSAARRA